jgi:hypothetical protein
MSAYETIQAAFCEARSGWDNTYGRMAPDMLIVVEALERAGLAEDVETGRNSLEWKINRALDHALTLTDGSYYDDETISECICEALGFEVIA